MNCAEQVTAKHIVDALRVPCLYSKSRKYSPQADDDQTRWLLTLPKESSHSSQAMERTMALLRSTFGPVQPPARPSDHDLVAIHVGLDSTNGVLVKKLYLELAGPSDLVFLATKSKNGVEDTHSYQSVPPEAALSELDLPKPYSCVANRLIEQADARTPTLLVTSAQTSRVSIDFNFSDSVLTEEFQTAMDALLALFRVPVGDRAARRNKPFSHVSLGQDGQGVPFVTLYGGPRWLMPAAMP